MMALNMDNHWAQLDEDRCPCLGNGWAEVDEDFYKECPIHYIGQLHPESRNLLMDDPLRLDAEERKSQLNFKIQEAKLQAAKLQQELREVQARILSLELELINKTPTRKMPVVTPNEPQLDIDEVEYEDFLLEDE